MSKKRRQGQEIATPTAPLTAPGTARAKTPRAAPVNQKRQKKLDPKELKTMYLQIVLNNIVNDKENAVNYIVYEYFRFVSATVYQRRYTLLKVQGKTMEEFVIEDVNMFTGLFRQRTNRQNAQVAKLTSVPPEIKIDFNDGQLVKFFVLMWLDSYHDETTKKSCKEYINALTIIKKPMKDFITNNLNLAGANLLSTDGIKLLNGGDYTASRGKFEAYLKNNLQRLFTSVGEKDEFVTTSKIELTNPSKRMSMLVDMEVNQGLTNFSLVNIDKVVSKLSVAQFMDPGVYMLTGMGLNDEVKQFFGIKNLSDIDANVVHEVKEKDNIQFPQIPGQLLNQYILNNYEFHFQHNGNTFLKIRSKFNPNLNPTNYETSRAIVLEMNTMDSSENWQLITPSKKVKVSGNFESPSNIINKFFGDCFQGMIVAGTNRVRPISNWFLATGDGNFCAIYAHLCDTMGVPCRMLVDNSNKEKTLTLYGGRDIVRRVLPPTTAPAISRSNIQNINTPGNNVTSKPSSTNVTNTNISNFLSNTNIITQEDAKQIFKQFIVDNDLQERFKKIKNSGNPFVKSQIISKFSEALKVSNNSNSFRFALGDLRQFMLSVIIS